MQIQHFYQHSINKHAIYEECECCFSQEPKTSQELDQRRPIVRLAVPYYRALHCKRRPAYDMGCWIVEGSTSGPIEWVYIPVSVLVMQAI